jgi:hypothetical protein
LQLCWTTWHWLQQLVLLSRRRRLPLLPLLLQVLL